jgi:hypothetical protein
VTGQRRGRRCWLTGRRATRWSAWGAASRSTKERRKEELTSVVRSAEVKQRQRNDVDSDIGLGGEQGQKKFLKPERREDMAGLDGTRGLR